MRTGPIVAAAVVAAAAGLAGTAHAVTVSGPRPPVVTRNVSRLLVASRHLATSHTIRPHSTYFNTETSSVSNLTPTSVTLNGVVSSYLWPVLYGFAYGTTASYGQLAPASGAPLAYNGSLSRTVSEQITGLTPGTTYHFTLAAESDDLDAASPDASFRTPPQPSPTTTTTTTTSTTPTTPGTSTTSTTPGATTPAATPTTAPPTPIVQQTAVVGASSGTVTVTEPGSTTPVELSAATSLPLGAVIDASHGVATVTNALAGGGAQSVSVWAGRFTMTQNRSGRTWFHLVGAPLCTAGSHAHAARKPPVTLWAHDHHGRYGTRGNNSVATVRGTVWETIESCAGTRTVVRRGVVSVRDLHTDRSVLVHAGHSVLVGP